MHLTINGTVIPLSPGISLPLVLRSPLFLTEEGKIPGSYVFNFTIPAGDAIRQVFGQAHRVQRAARATAELPYVISDGTLRYQGTCSVTEADADAYEIACKVNYPEGLAGKTLKDLDLGTDYTITDLCSLAHKASPEVYLQSDPEYLELSVVVPDEIITDYTSSLSLGGSTFTAPDEMDVTLRINVLASFILGTLHVIVKKNGTLLDEASFNSASTTSLFGLSLSLIADDEITIEAIAESEVSNEGYTINFTLDDFAVEYSRPNIFTTTANDLLDQDTSDFAIFPVYNAEFLANFPDDAFQVDNLSIKTLYSTYFPVLNYYKNGEFPLFLTGTIEGETLFCANLFTPFVYMRKLLNQLASEAGFTIVNNPFDTTYFKNMVLFNAYAENTYTSNATTILPIKPAFNLTDHVPEMAQSDFLRWVSVLTGFMPVTDNVALTITFVDIKNKHIITSLNPAIPFPGFLLDNPKVTVAPEYKGIKLELKKAGTDKYLDNIKELSDKFIYKGLVADPRDLPASGNLVNDLYEVSSNNSWYVYQYNPETYQLEWCFYSKKFPIVYTEGVEPYLNVSTELCPVLTTRILDEVTGAPESRLWTIPRTDQAGILEGFPDSLSAEYGTQVLYYKGLSLDSTAEPYPLGTPRYDDYTGDPLFFPDLSATALFDTQYKAWLQWLAYTAKPVTYKCILTRAQLRQIRWGQIYSGNGFNFLVKEVNINLLVDGLSMGEVEVYTC